VFTPKPTKEAINSNSILRGKLGGSNGGRRHEGLGRMSLRWVAILVRLGGSVFVAEVADDVSSEVKFVEVLGEDGLLFVVFKEGVSASEFVVLLDTAVKESVD
jgi:hypothetical protein